MEKFQPVKSRVLTPYLLGGAHLFSAPGSVGKFPSKKVPSGAANILLPREPGEPAVFFSLKRGGQGVLAYSLGEKVTQALRGTFHSGGQKVNLKVIKGVVCCLEDAGNSPLFVLPLAQKDGAYKPLAALTPYPQKPMVYIELFYEDTTPLAVSLGQSVEGKGVIFANSTTRFGWAEWDPGEVPGNIALLGTEVYSYSSSGVWVSVRFEARGAIKMSPPFCIYGPEAKPSGEAPLKALPFLRSGGQGRV